MDKITLKINKIRESLKIYGVKDEEMDKIFIKHLDILHCKIASKIQEQKAEKTIEKIAKGTKIKKEKVKECINILYNKLNHDPIFCNGDLARGDLTLTPELVLWYYDGNDEAAIFLKSKKLLTKEEIKKYC